MNKFKDYLKRVSKNYFNEFTKSDFIWLTIATIVIIVAIVIGFDPSTSIFMNAIIAIGTLTGTWCVILVNKQKLSNYAFGLLNVILFWNNVFNIWYVWYVFS